MFVDDSTSIVPLALVIVHLGDRNVDFQHYAFWEDVWRLCCGQVVEVSCKSDVYSELPRVRLECTHSFYLTLGACVQLQVCGVIFLPYIVIPGAYMRYGQDQGSELQESVVWERVVFEPTCVHVDDHVHHRPHSVLP